MSLFTKAPLDEVVDAVAAPTPVADGGHVLFVVGPTMFAVAVTEIREITRAPRLSLLPVAEGATYGRAVALVDVRGRAVPVVDLRSDASLPGEVLLPMWRRNAGLVVDRVASVTSAGDLVAETDEVADTLPAYAVGVLRPVDGGAPVLLIALPDAATLT